MDPIPKLTFAGVELIVPPESLKLSVRVDTIFQKPNRPYSTHLDMAHPNYRDFNRAVIDVGTLYWPVGASRWSIGLFLVSSEQLEGHTKLRGPENTGIRGVTCNEQVSQGKLEMCTSYGKGAPVLSVDMWMLPPIPVNQIFVGGEEEKNLYNYPKKHLNGMWVLPLVDSRYFWWTKRITSLKTSVCSGWGEVLESILDHCEIPRNDIEKPHARYGPCPAAFREIANENNVPVLLDIMAGAFNQKIIMGYSGRVHTTSAEEASYINSAQKVKYDTVVEGGTLNFSPTLEKEFNDLSYLLPEFFTFDFSPSKIKVPTKDLSTFLPSMRYRKNEQVFIPSEASSFGVQTGLCAKYSPKKGTTEGAHEQQAAKAFYKKYLEDWLILQKSPYSLLVPGIVPWAPNSLLDSVTFTFQDKKASTHIQRVPFTQFPNLVWYESLLGGSDCPQGFYPCGQCKGINQPHVNGETFKDRQIPQHPEGTQRVPPQPDIGLPTGKETKEEVENKWPNWTAPPYVLRYCVGKAMGNVSIDFETWETAKISVFWNGRKVASRVPTGRGSKHLTCGSCGPATGRMTFYKDAKYPTTVTVVVDSDYIVGSGYTRPYNREHPAWTRFVVNVRCVDSAPEPAPKCLACDAKMISLPTGFSDLREFLVGFSLANQGAQGGLPIKTPVCGTGFQPFVIDACAKGKVCEISPNITATFTQSPSVVPLWKGTSFPMSVDYGIGGYTGIVELRDASILMFNLRTGVNNKSFSLYYKIIDMWFDVRKKLMGDLHYENATKTFMKIADNMRICTCDPFSLTVKNRYFSLSPGFLEIKFTEEI